MNKIIKEHILTLESEFNLISEDRKKLLENCALHVSNQIREKGSSEIIVICTHNSRRSQLAELWIAIAAKHYHLPTISSFSGGSESTAFNHRMVNGLIDFGLQFGVIRAGENPHYAVSVEDLEITKSCFSKVYSDSFNPQKDFIAILVCHSADEACPTIFGAAHRFFIPYVDPKRADDTSNEKTTYADKIWEIGREMMYLVSRVDTSI